MDWQILQNEAVNGLVPRQKKKLYTTNQLTTVKCSTNRDALFRTVVALNHGRILSRIQSRHASKRQGSIAPEA